MIFGSVCSGIEAASVAWHPLGWRAAFVSEIEPFPSAVLAHHYPSVPNLGDMTRFQEWPDAAIDVLVGGTPCQSFSVAGLRKGLSDPRGNLALVYLAMADRYRPEWLVWENVPGVLSSGGGRDFGAFLGALGQLGYGWAYRVLDAQFFGVAQRRRRVFVVASLGGWQRAGAVLFERHSLSGHPAPRREAGEGSSGRAMADANDSRRPAEVACTLYAQFGAKQGLEDQHALGGAPLFVPTPFDTTQITSAANYSSPKPGDPCHPLAAGAHAPAIAFAQNQRDEVRTMDVAGALAAEPGAKQQTYIAFSCKDHGADAGEVAPTLRAMGGALPNGGGQVAVAFGWQNSSAQGDDVRAECAPTLDKSKTPAVAFAIGSHAGCADGDQTNRSHAGGGPVGSNVSEELAYSLRAGRLQSVASAMAVRRLTPRECERLQGFPDDYTLIPWRKKPASECPDGPRYKALGNSMAVPVMRWIGERIARVCAQLEAA